MAFKSYVVTGHRFIGKTRFSPDEPYYQVQLCDLYASMDAKPEHITNVSESDLAQPQYQMGAIWNLTFSGESRRDWDYED